MEPNQEQNQSSLVREGLSVYIGTTGTGKTHKALRDALSLAAVKRQGLLIIDSRGAENLATLELSKINSNWRERLYHEGRIIRIVPETESDFEVAIKTVEKNGNCILFIDEVSTWASNPNLQNLCRVWRHRKVSIFLTTQKIGMDIQQGILACDPVLFVFRTTAPTSLEWLEKWHRIPADTLRNLRMPAGDKGGEYFELSF